MTCLSENIHVATSPLSCPHVYFCGILLLDTDLFKTSMAQNNAQTNNLQNNVQTRQTSSEQVWTNQPSLAQVHAHDLSPGFGYIKAFFKLVTYVIKFCFCVVNKSIVLHIRQHQCLSWVCGKLLVQSTHHAIDCLCLCVIQLSEWKFLLKWTSDALSKTRWNSLSSLMQRKCTSLDSNV